MDGTADRRFLKQGVAESTSASGAATPSESSNPGTRTKRSPACSAATTTTRTSARQRSDTAAVEHVRVTSGLAAAQPEGARGDASPVRVVDSPVEPWAARSSRRSASCSGPTASSSSGGPIVGMPPRWSAGVAGMSPRRAYRPFETGCTASVAFGAAQPRPRPGRAAPFPRPCSAGRARRTASRGTSRPRGRSRRRTR
jgi:hypothetical protein